eukprot:jgi/Botrbrau1/14272/Bobra.0368s0004.1
MAMAAEHRALQAESRADVAEAELAEGKRRSAAAIYRLEHENASLSKAANDKAREKLAALQLATRDRKLAQLRDTIQDLEQKLLEALRRSSAIATEDDEEAQEALKAARWEAQQAHAAAAAAEERAREAERQLELTEEALLDLTKAVKDKERHLAGLQELLEGEERTVSELRGQLGRERARFAQLAALGTDGEPNLATGPSGQQFQASQ